MCRCPRFSWSLQLLTILTRDKVYSRLARCWAYALLKESIVLLFFNVTWDLVPQVCYSDREKLAPDVQSAVSDANVQWVSCCPGSSERFPCHAEPLRRICLVLTSEDLVDHGHVGLVAPLLQRCHYVISYFLNSLLNSMQPLVNPGFL